MSRRALAVCGVAGAVVLATLASFTRPFTVPADAVVLLGAAWIIALGYLDRRMGAGGAETTGGGAGTGRPPAGAWGLRWGLWAVAIGAAVGWELFCFFSSPRQDHPTASSMLDVVDAHRPWLGLVFALWLVLGWRLVER